MPKQNKNSKRVGSSTPSTTGKPTGCDVLHQPLVGVSKLKSQLRQARRLLQKEGLTSELRQSTELKITQLQEALEKNPKKEQERRNAIKYHRIKFFDRKKVARRLKKVIHELDLVGKDEKPDKSKESELEQEVQRLRIDLNYVQHYPKHLKYVALFPGGEYKDHQLNPAPPSDAVPSSKDPDSLRNYVRNYIARAMESGALSKIPETVQQQETDDNNELEPSNVAMEVDDFFEPAED